MARFWLSSTARLLHGRLPLIAEMSAKSCLDLLSAQMLQPHDGLEPGLDAHALRNGSIRKVKRCGTDRYGTIRWGNTECTDANHLFRADCGKQRVGWDEIPAFLAANAGIAPQPTRMQSGDTES